MSRTTRTKLLATNARAQRLACNRVQQYFAALAAGDALGVFARRPAAPHLVDAYNEIRAAFLGPNHDRSITAGIQETIEAEEIAAANAGYLIGVEVGRRLGGVR